MQILPLQKNQKGFTLIEVLIALTLFSIAITGVITVASQGSFNNKKTQDYITAGYLADEGIELARGYRDTKVLSAPTAKGTTGWNAFTSGVASSGPCSPVLPCGLDISSSTSIYNLFVCPNGYGCQLYRNANTGKFTHNVTNAEPNPKFKRGIAMYAFSNNGGAAPAYLIRSTVYWNEGNVIRMVERNTYFMNWY